MLPGMPRPTASPIPRAEWLAARALLASRRLRPFVPFGIGAFALVFATVFAVRGPLASRAAAAQRAAGRAIAVEQDTVPLITGLEAARAALVERDSALRARQFQAEARAASPSLSTASRRDRDLLRLMLGQLDGSLDRAAKAPLPASYRELANTPALRSTGGVQSLVDTLDRLDSARQSLDPLVAPQREFAELSQRANLLGGALQGMGQLRRAALVRQIAVLEAGEDAFAVKRVRPVDTATVRIARDSARQQVSHAIAQLRGMRQWHADVQSRADSAARARAARILGASPFAAAFSALVTVMVLGFTLTVVAESRAPTIAYAREVERLTTLPVLAVVDRFRIPREGRARLQAGSGIDPLRMVYLALTASGTRVRTVCVTGDSGPITTAIAARLAVSAAADECATLVVDLAAGTPAASAYFGWRDEPGFTEAIAGVQLWREVARPIGASDGMAIDVIPAGGPRQDTEASVAGETTRGEFIRFIGEYDFAVLVAPTPASAVLASAACGGPPTIVVVRTAKTKFAAMYSSLEHLRKAAVSTHGILLVDG